MVLVRAAKGLEAVPTQHTARVGGSGHWEMSSWRTQTIFWSFFCLKNDFHFLRYISLKAQRLKKIKIALWDWNFQARLKISSELLAKPLFLWRNLTGQDWKFQARLKFSIETENFNRDWFFSILGPLGVKDPLKIPLEKKHKNDLARRFFWWFLPRERLLP